jgi:phospholipid N-methyltransferase
MKSLLLFWREALKKPRTIGAWGPSSPAVAKAMTHPLTSRAGPVRVLEVGPGTGAVTERIVEHLRAGDELDLCEINADFARWLRQRFENAGGPDRPRVRVIEGDVLCSAPGPYDFILSSVPWSNLRPEFVESLLQGLIARLAPGGVLAYLHYRGQRLRWGLTLGKERQRLRQVIAITRRYQRRHGLGKDSVWLSFPPADVYYLTRDPARAGYRPRRRAVA